MIKELNDFITINYNKYLKISKKFYNGEDDPYDILHECIIYLSELSDEEQQNQMEYIDKYLTTMIRLSSQSKTSRYQYQKTNRLNFTYNNNIAIEDENINPYFIYHFEDIEKCLEDNCNDWYVKNVFMTYIKSNLTFMKFSKKTNIPVSSLYKAYKDGCEIIKNNFKIYE